MSFCSSGDLALILNSTSTLQTCLNQASSSALFPTGSGAQQCMSSVGVSSGCSSCWGNFFNETYTCVVNECNSNLNPDQTSATFGPCTSCAETLGNQYDLAESVCGFSGTENELGQLISEILQWLDNVARLVDTFGGSVTSPWVVIFGFSIFLFLF